MQHHGHLSPPAPALYRGSLFCVGSQRLDLPTNVFNVKRLQIRSVCAHCHRKQTPQTDTSKRPIRLLKNLAVGGDCKSVHQKLAFALNLASRRIVRKCCDARSGIAQEVFLGHSWREVDVPILPLHLLMDKFVELFGQARVLRQQPVPIRLPEIRGNRKLP